ncbi:hypothetical protein FHW67_000629 [Herbaspirillum sp. Sphag1AN]|uniref:hypothetical protein n=1 Tax=unclassified Herbaspirillum TaxID=2624150 RepID=UPI001620C189|nr:MULTISPECIES: hypothetical protein [unclassified Herbaspirillum]MBB3211381.1 hypothetical protein [Herbaspirillum sp. Sphag1AN]MBB3245352.1 hypothetical protein [Herbaspirillum sp. Sphag64]
MNDYTEGVLMVKILKMTIVIGLLSYGSIAAAESTNPACYIDARGYLCCPWNGNVECDPATGPD